MDMLVVGKTPIPLPPPPKCLPINVSNCGIFLSLGVGGRGEGKCLATKTNDLFEKKERDLHSLDFGNRFF
jgi:hypothetical protein